jgi:hypothetical protein
MPPTLTGYIAINLKYTKVKKSEIDLSVEFKKVHDDY